MDTDHVDAEHWCDFVYQRSKKISKKNIASFPFSWIVVFKATFSEKIKSWFELLSVSLTAFFLPMQISNILLIQHNSQVEDHCKAQIDKSDRYVRKYVAHVVSHWES